MRSRSVSGQRSYPVLVGAGARHRLGEWVPVGARRAAIVTQAAHGLDRGPRRSRQRTFTIDDGEEAKNLETIEELCREWAAWGLHRTDVVVAVGGGVVTDAAGFAAAVYHRGIPVIHVPTTLLGQVDAAIGGKTGVNLPEGKNLVGAFWQPAAVLCDIETLATLPPREYRSGLGEMAKYAFLGVGALADLRPRGRGGGLRGGQGARRRRRRARDRGPGAAQLRPHPRPRPRDRRRLRPAPR